MEKGIVQLYERVSDGKGNSSRLKEAWSKRQRCLSQTFHAFSCDYLDVLSVSGFWTQGFISPLSIFHTSVISLFENLSPSIVCELSPDI